MTFAEKCIKNGMALQDILHEARKALVSHALIKCYGSQQKAAMVIGINRQTLRKHIGGSILSSANELDSIVKSAYVDGNCDADARLMAVIRRDAVRYAMKVTGDNQTKAAELLKANRGTFCKYLREAQGLML